MDNGRLSESTFEFSPTLSDCNGGEALSVQMSPADELFCNGRIRPMKPTAVPQKTPLPNFEHQSKAQSSVTSKKGNDTEEKCRGRQRNENKNRHRCLARSLSPGRNSFCHWGGKGNGQKNDGVIHNSAEEEGLEGIKIVGSASSSTQLKPRGSRRKWSLTDFIFRRCKSDGAKLDSDEMGLSFSSYSKLPSSDKEKKRASAQAKDAQKKQMAGSATNRTAYISSPNRKGVPVSAQELHYISSPNRKGVRVSAHELHYTENRAQAEELRKKTLLPYKQGVLGCLRLSSAPASPQGHVLQPLY